MAYQIIYPWDKEKELKNMNRFSGWSYVGLLAVAAAIALRLLNPSDDTVLSMLLHPLMDEDTIVAFSQMVDIVSAGTPVGEAVTAFCREILENAA